MFGIWFVLLTYFYDFQAQSLFNVQFCISGPKLIIYVKYHAISSKLHDDLMRANTHSERWSHLNSTDCIIKPVTLNVNFLKRFLAAGAEFSTKHWRLKLKLRKLVVLQHIMSWIGSVQWRLPSAIILSSLSAGCSKVWDSMGITQCQKCWRSCAWILSRVDDWIFRI